MNHTNSFGYWLRRRRKAIDLTQAALAQQVNCSLDLIQKIETDVRRPSRQIAERLADKLGLEAAERVAFIQAARAERTVDQLALPGQPIELSRRSSRINVPTQLTGLIGREQEVAAVCLLLRRADIRLVTLTGPGGVGKTRLGLQIAEVLSADFTDGVCFVDLTPVRDPSRVPSAIAQVLGVRDSGNQPLLESLKRALRDKHMLLLIDNFEQVIDAAAQIAELLAATTRLTLLVTSRERLHIRREQEIVVQPLALPDPADLPALDRVSQSAAVALFVERAQASQPNFQVTPTNAGAIAAICVRLDGLPLAIELAAARIKLFSPQVLLERLSKRLELLTSGPRDLPARQRTIRDTIAWSYDLLNASEQRLFRRLAVFVGGCTLEAIETVASDPSDVQPPMIDLVAALLDKSLLQQIEAQDGSTRFVMLETIREYALEQLEASGEAEHLRWKHAHYYQKFGATVYYQAAETDRGRDWEASARRLNPEFDNVYAALVWSQTMAGDPEMIFELACAVGAAWMLHGVRREAIDAFERSIAHAPVIGCTVGHYRARMDLGELLGGTGNYPAARIHFDQALLIAHELGDTKRYAQTLERLGWLAREQGDSTSAWQRMTESLTILREIGVAFDIAETLTSMAGIAILDEDPSRAEALLAECRAIGLRENADVGWIGWTLNHLGQVAQLRGDYDRAAQLHHESLTLWPNDYHWGMIAAYHSLGQTSLGLGHLYDAEQWFVQGLEISQTVSDQASSAWCLAGLGTAAALHQQPERAARLWGAAERLRMAIGCRPAPAARVTYERAIAIARAQLGEEAFAAAWEEGQALSLEKALAEALADGS